MKQKQITFTGMNLKQIEFKPFVFRLYKINNEWNKYFDKINSYNDMLSDKLLNNIEKIELI